MISLPLWAFALAIILAIWLIALIWPMDQGSSYLGEPLEILFRIVLCVIFTLLVWLAYFAFSYWQVS